MIVKLPGTMSSAGSMTNEFVHVRDIMPTILDIADVTHSLNFDGRTVRPMQGQSVLDFISGATNTPYAGSSQVGYELFGLKAFFDGDWKILNMPPPFGTGEWELYNLSEDPAETIDLSSTHTEKFEEMIKMWERYKEDNTVLDVSLDLTRGFE
jgi:arylsulfatase